MTGKRQVWYLYIFPGVPITYIPEKSRLVISPVFIAFSSGSYSYMGFAGRIFFSLCICGIFCGRTIREIVASKLYSCGYRSQ